MKHSFVISFQDSRFGSVAHGHWQENMEVMSSSGFQGVELAVRNPELVPANELASLLEKYRLELVAIGTGQVYVDDGLSLSDRDGAVRDKALARLKGLIDLAGIFHCQIIIGLIRGSVGKDYQRQTGLKYLRDSVVAAAGYAKERNVILTIEPINRYETDCFNQAGEVISFIRETGCHNLRLLLDTFHMNIEEKDICGTLIGAKDYLSHIHIADSNSRCPGEGHLDFSKIVDTLSR